MHMSTLQRFGAHERHLARHVGAADGLLHAAARLMRQQTLPHAHDLHRQLAAGDDHHRLPGASACMGVPERAFKGHRVNTR